MTRNAVRLDANVVLVDIEGTTTPIWFVYDVLFPFARRRIGEWCRRHAGSPEYRDVLKRLAAEHAGDRTGGRDVPPWRDDTPEAAEASLETYAGWLMAADRKSPALKLLQGLVWEEGYRSGELRGQVFPDVAPAMSRWHHDGVRVAIYSSGSERAQRLLFSSTHDGDLTAFISGFFDTAVGPKTSAESYRRIQSYFGVPASQIVFVSDVTAELDAARAAGLHAMLCVRPGNKAQPGADAYVCISSFDELELEAV